MKLAESALLRTGAAPGGVPSLSLVLISSSRTTIGTGQRRRTSASRAMTSSARSGGTTADSLARCAHAVMSYPPLDGPAEGAAWLRVTEPFPATCRDCP